MDFTKPLKDILDDSYPTVMLDDNLKKALKSMANDHTTALLVKQNDELVGIITISDIMHSLVKGDDPAETSVSTFMTSCELLSGKSIKSPCVQLDEDEDLLAAIKLMNEAGVDHILVSGSRGEPAGMVSSLEIVKHLVS